VTWRASRRLALLLLTKEQAMKKRRVCVMRRASFLGWNMARNQRRKPSLWGH
jgi:hypothetical protein